MYVFLNNIMFHQETSVKTIKMANRVSTKFEMWYIVDFNVIFYYMNKIFVRKVACLYL